MGYTHYWRREKEIMLKKEDRTTPPPNCPKCNSFRTETTETLFMPETSHTRTEYKHCLDCGFSWGEDYDFKEWYPLKEVRR